MFDVTICSEIKNIQFLYIQDFHLSLDLELV